MIAIDWVKYYGVFEGWTDGAPGANPVWDLLRGDGYDVLPWCDLGTDCLVGFCVLGAELSPGPDGATVLYGHYSDARQGFFIELSSDGGVTCYRRAKLPDECGAQ